MIIGDAGQIDKKEPILSVRNRVIASGRRFTSEAEPHKLLNPPTALPGRVISILKVVASPGSGTNDPTISGAQDVTGTLIHQELKRAVLKTSF